MNTRAVLSDGPRVRFTFLTVNPAVATLRALAKGLWYLPERLLHPFRRRAARERLAGLRPRGVLFVCHGNVCRSPYAAYAFQRALPARLVGAIEIRSAGFIGPDRPSPPKALEAAARRGLDMQAHRSQLISQQLADLSDLVVVVSEAQARAFQLRHGRPGLEILVLGDLDPQSVSRRTIPDPWGKDDRAFDESYDRVDRCVSELVRILARTARMPVDAPHARRTRA